MFWEKSGFKRHNFVRFLHYVRPYTKYVILAIIGGVVKFAVPMLVPLIIRHLFDNVFLSDSMTTEQKQGELIFYLGGLVGIFLFVYAPWVYVRHQYVAKAGLKAAFALRCDLYYRILRMSASFFKRRKSGSILSRLMNDMHLVQNLVGPVLTNIWLDGAALILAVVLMFRCDVRATLVALGTFPVYLYFFRKFRRVIRYSAKQVQEEISEMSGNVSERISGSIVVHAFTQEKNERTKFQQESAHLYSTTMRRSFYQSLHAMTSFTLTNISPLVVIFYCGWRIVTDVPESDGAMTIGTLTAMIFFLGYLYTPLQRFSDLNVLLANATAALDRIFEIMDEDPEIASRPGAVAVEKIEGRVEFEEVKFSYDEDEPVLNDISFSVQPGQQVALVGPSGSGKSTIAGLIPRFYDVESGAIKIDGKDIRDFKVKSLRSHIGMVLQDPILFSGSIRENILYGDPTADEKRLVEACKAANAMEFIGTLPDGFDSEVGERGNFLSGGQKQRLTLARAFLKNPQILILDEATSSLDSESEHLIQNAMDRLVVGRTTFIIAHRLSTIVNSDLILVLENGSIKEAGTHKELLQNGSLYHHLYEQQFESARSSWDLLSDS